MRNWTADQEATAYDTFKAMAEVKDVQHAQEVMRGLMRAGADFTEAHIEAWTAQYEKGN